MCLPTAKAPKISSVAAPAPAPAAPEVQRQLAPKIDQTSTGQKRSRSGRSSLRIDLAQAPQNGGGASGLNIPVS